MNSTVIRTEGLTKHYGRSIGIEDLSLNVRRGEILGFLGPNGAGKTTTIRLLLGFIHPTSGRAEVLGRDIVAASVDIRRSVGYLPGEVSLYPNLNGRQLVGLSARVRGGFDLGRADRLARRLEADMERRIRQCSRGMRQKVALVLALAHDPDLLILDEPTSGLDPLVQQTVLDLLREERERGRTVFFSSHNLPEVESICDRVAVIREGRLIVLDSVENLVQHKHKRVRVAYTGEPPDLEGLEGVDFLSAESGRLELRYQGDVNRLLERLARSRLTDLLVSEPSLEQVFFTFYQKEGEPQ